MRKVPATMANMVVYSIAPAESLAFLALKERGDGKRADRAECAQAEANGEADDEWILEGKMSYEGIFEKGQDGLLIHGSNVRASRFSQHMKNGRARHWKQWCRQIP
jgi:hypothetical protein